MKNELKKMTIDELIMLRDRQTDAKRIELINDELKRR